MNPLNTLKLAPCYTESKKRVGEPTVLDLETPFWKKCEMNRLIALTSTLIALPPRHIRKMMSLDFKRIGEMISPFF